MQLTTSWTLPLRKKNDGTALKIRRVLLFLSTTSLFAGLACPQSPPPTTKCPPTARIDSAKDVYGAAVVADPYR